MNICVKKNNDFNKYYQYSINITDNLATKDPFFRKFKPWAFQTREEQYEICLQKHLYINKKCNELNLTEPVDKFFYTEYATLNSYFL